MASAITASASKWRAALRGAGARDEGGRPARARTLAAASAARGTTLDAPAAKGARAGAPRPMVALRAPPDPKNFPCASTELWLTQPRMARTHAQCNVGHVPLFLILDEG